MSYWQYTATWGRVLCKQISRYLVVSDSGIGFGRVVGATLAYPIDFGGTCKILVDSVCLLGVLSARTAGSLSLLSAVPTRLAVYNKKTRILHNKFSQDFLEEMQESRFGVEILGAYRVISCYGACME